ncbi:tudor domain-containing protein 3 [Lucilia cuprina]|uniref:tudor domain-containing protein 3 n=1 Tax=Lucilia cuprina TaxID=7375 RepID=UPI001F06412A|nr:tudor domain-containing protein 3 [Lucilia cuprina]
MALLEKLQEQGWYLTEEGLRKLTISNNLQTEDVNKIISLALDWDLKDIAAGALPSKPDSNGTISGRIVLQIQKMRNISAPKANEESTAAPRFLQLELSDGANTIAALEFERIPSLNLNVPPGTKLLIKAEKIKLLNGFLVLKPSDIQILGGKVEALVEKWEVARQMLKYARSNRRLSGSGGPPPWIAFGKRLDAHKDALPTDRNFKSLQAATEKDKNSKENDEFNVSRSQAIAEAAKAGQKKVFGGGQQNILDHNVKKILEKGYSEEEAKQALKTTNNNLERALYNLKRRNNIRSGSTDNSAKTVTTSTGGRVRDRVASAKEEATAAKPQTNVSLFDFLTDKLPVTVSSSNTVQSQAISNNTNNDRNLKDSSSKTYNNTKAISVGGNRFENNLSSSFAANRATVTPRSEEKQPFQSRSNTFNQRQEERKQQSSNKPGRGGERNNTNRTQTQSQTSNYDKPLNQSSVAQEENIKSTGGNNTKRNERKKEREQTPRQPMNEYLPNKRNNEFNKPLEKKSYQSRENNRNNNQDSTKNFPQKQTQKPNNNFEKALDNLVESTSKMSIQQRDESTANNQQNRGRNHQQTSKGNSHQQMPTLSQHKQKSSSENYPNNSQQQPNRFIDSQNFSAKSQQNTKNPAYVPQVGNGFAYDSSKIMGFQSKEANEYAMNLLKSQGLTMQQLQQQQAVSPQTQQGTLPPPQQPHSQNQILNNQATATVAYMAQNPNLFVAPPQQAPPQFGMMSSGNWPWNIGDLCLAKYWDDGNYYDAKITAISDKTCVVLFLGYGNHEEVLKSDCLPITDAQHIPLNAYQTNITAPPMAQPHPSAFQPRSNIHSGVGGSSGNQRYRGERQMYVPPPKRNNN